MPRLEELGGSHLLCGVARLIMCLAEVPVFYLSGAMIRCMGVRGVIALAQTAYFIRFMYYSVSFTSLYRVIFILVSCDLFLGGY